MLETGRAVCLALSSQRKLQSFKPATEADAKTVPSGLGIRNGHLVSCAVHRNTEVVMILLLQVGLLQKSRDTHHSQPHSPPALRSRVLLSAFIVGPLQLLALFLFNSVGLTIAFTSVFLVRGGGVTAEGEAQSFGSNLFQHRWWETLYSGTRVVCRLW